MVGQKLAWSRVFAETLPKWAFRRKSDNLSYWLLGLTIVPVFFGTAASHSAHVTDGRMIAISTLNYACCAQAVRLAFHSGFQTRFFGLPGRSMELHPLICIGRYLSPLLPFGLVVVSLRTSFEFPHLSARYLIYSCLVSTLLDFSARGMGLIPPWLLKVSVIHGVCLFGCLAALGSSENVIVDIK